MGTLLAAKVRQMVLFSVIVTSYFNSLSQMLSSGCAACFQRFASARPFQSAMNFDSNGASAVKSFRPPLVVLIAPILKYRKLGDIVLDDVPSHPRICAINLAVAEPW